MYSALMSSCFCRTCLLQMAFKSSQPVRDDNAIRLNRLRFQFRSLNMVHSEGIEALPMDRQNSHWQASVLGPTASLYKVHPNVFRHGDV